MLEENGIDGNPNSEEIADLNRHISVVEGYQKSDKFNNAYIPFITYVSSSFPMALSDFIIYYLFNLRGETEIFQAIYDMLSLESSSEIFTSVYILEGLLAYACIYYIIFQTVYSRIESSVSNHLCDEISSEIDHIKSQLVTKKQLKVSIDHLIDFRKTIHDKGEKLLSAVIGTIFLNLFLSKTKDPGHTLSYIMPISKAIFNASKRHGVLIILHWLYEKYNSYFPKIPQFEKNIKNISCLSSEIPSWKWKLDKDDYDDRFRLASLKIESETVAYTEFEEKQKVFSKLLSPRKRQSKKSSAPDRCFRENSEKSNRGNSSKISRKNYLIELNRILWEEHIPVYFSGKNEIFVGFFDADKKRVEIIKNKLFKRLKSIGAHEEKSNNILCNLNSARGHIKSGKKNFWKYDFVYDENNDIKTCYYLRIDNIKRNYIEMYLFALQEIAPPEKIKFENDIITLFDLTEEESQKIKEKIGGIQKIQKEGNHPTPSKSKTNKPTTDYFYEEALKAQAEKDKKGTPHDKGKNPQPEPNREDKSAGQNTSLSFFKRANKSNDCKPFIVNGTQYYPLHLPWLSEEKTAVSCLNPKTHAAIKESYPSALPIVYKILENGTLHCHASQKKGGKYSMKSQPGNDYEDSNGKKCESQLKLKAPNKIGIFACKNDNTVTDSEGKEHLVWEFNGAHFRH